jgi:hypothetical protein
VGGILLDAFEETSGRWLFLPVDSFSPVFLVGTALLGTSALIMSRLRTAEPAA